MTRKRAPLGTGKVLKQLLVWSLLPAAGLVSTASQAAEAAAGITSKTEEVKETREASFDHSHRIWDELLKVHVKPLRGGQESLFDYGAIKKDSQSFKAYLSALSSVSEATFKTFSRDEQLAFLINAYNAFIVDLVVDNYPLSSIKTIGIPFVGPWKKSYIPLLGKKMSPDDLEHGLIRKEYKESRIHFGVNCASISCPPLRAEAFVASKLSSQLDEQASLFFANAKENRFDAKAKTLTLNPILDWFDEDFTTTGAEGQVRYVAKYLAELAKALEGGLKASEVSVSFGDYNWDLNDTAQVKKN